ncbi:MAG: hypothetical protein PF513_04160, partial [Tenericutes bacterium]|nr:hypothetical protein [Mycoplasmatota bacterium]
MYYLFLILPLPVLFGISLYFNNRKYFAGSGNKIIVSILEGIGMYLVVSAIFMEGFIGNPFLQIAIFVLGFIVLIISNNRINELEPEFDDQIETLKNLLVIFASTVLLFYVLLSVFRFQPFYLQFLYAIAGTVLFNVLAHYIKKITSELYDRLDFSNFMFVSFRIWYVYLGVFGLIFIIA